MAEDSVVASVHERGSSVVEALRKMEVPVRFEELSVVDYLVGGARIKRLTVEEFRRLASGGGILELAEKLAEVGTPVIVVEGRHHHGRQQLADVIATLALKGVNLVNTSGAEETAYVVYAFYCRITARRKKGYLPPSKVRRRSSNSISEAQISILASVPGIGEETARKLLLHFKTPRKALTAPFHELEKIIGRARARKLTDALDTIYPQELGREALTGGGEQPPNS